MDVCSFVHESCVYLSMCCRLCISCMTCMHLSTVHWFLDLPIHYFILDAHVFFYVCVFVKSLIYVRKCIAWICMIQVFIYSRIWLPLSPFRPLPPFQYHQRQKQHHKCKMHADKYNIITANDIGWHWKCTLRSTTYCGLHAICKEHKFLQDLVCFLTCIFHAICNTLYLVKAHFAYCLPHFLPVHCTRPFQYLKLNLSWYIHTYMHTCIHASMHPCMHACMHTYMHAYMHTCIHA